MKKIKLIPIFLIFSVILSGCNNSENSDAEVCYEPLDSVTVGCIISEEYDFFTEQLSVIAETLNSKGYIKNYENKNAETAEEVWNLICNSKHAENILFEKDYFYNFDSTPEIQLEEMNNADLMLVFGTSAGVWLTENANKIFFNYMVFASADPISAGIVKSETERYNNKSFAHVDPGRIRRQIELAYEIYPFNSIGVVYEDSDEAYSYSGIAQLEDLSEKYGFEICTINVDEPENKNDYDRYYSELKSAYSKLIPQIDALYITTGMIEDEKLPWLLSDVHGAGIITVAETSESQVESGAMMHITMSDAEEEGQFAAETLIKYFGGIPVNELPQTFLITPHISLNRDTIEKIGVEITMNVYLIADKIYEGNANEK